MKYFTRDPNCLGYIVYYGASAVKKLQVDNFNDELKKNDIRFRIQSTRAVTAIVRAAKAIEGLSEGRLFYRAIINDSDEKVVGIFRQEVKHSERTVQFEHKTTGTYNKQEKLFTAEGPDKVIFKKLFKEYSSCITGDDIRRLTRKIAESSNCISLRGSEHVRDAGGIYFVPGDRIDTLESLKHVLEKMEIGYVRALCVIDGKSERADIFESAIIYYQNQIKSIMEQATKITDRVSSLRNLQKRLEEVEVRTVVYGDLTGKAESEQIVEIKSKIKKCINKIDRKMKRLQK